MYPLLNGLTVIEASSFVASPSCGLYLAQMGADVGEAGNPSGKAYPAAGAFATLPGTTRQPPQPAPRNGEHSEAILTERLGLASGAIARLIDDGVVGVG